MNWSRWGQTLEQTTLYFKLSPFLTCDKHSLGFPLDSRPFDGVWGVWDLGFVIYFLKSLNLVPLVSKSDHGNMKKKIRSTGPSFNKSHTYAIAKGAAQNIFLLNMTLNRWIFEFLTSKAPDIIAQGDLHCPELSFDVWQAIFGQKLQKINFFRLRNTWVWILASENLALDCKNEIFW